MSTAVAGTAATRRLPAVARAAGRLAVAYAGALVVFGALVAAKGANPLQVYASMLRSTFLDQSSAGEVLVRATPLVLAALAVAVPARAGLVNVGGEGQIVVGAVAAAGAGLALDQVLAGTVTILAMALAGALAGALWAGIAALLRLTVKVNEAITTLLLNYVAIDLMLYLIYQPWKDRGGSGQPATRALAEQARLPLIAGTRVHTGIFLALVATVVVWLALQKTSWGFRLRVVGGNPEAARRAGLPVRWLLLSAMLVGGALAGLGGMAHFAGAELKLRPGMTFGFGYIAFLASWLARHSPGKVAAAALLLAVIAIGGDSLQIDSGLPAAAVNILMALVLVAVMARPGSAGDRGAGGRAGAVAAA
ncbi:MAG TPA: ABC transporter permease [Actinomycetota bacterium]